ncbi:PilZ domain-containing protein [Sphingopyxis sp. J-6]|uniref:PilZ domain-containing protein n=1 Tax=Sphingopyxis sp. J-6 TaxID=3122054 RepID=UPI00398403F3
MPDPGAETDLPAAADQRQPRQSRLVKAELGCARLGRFDVTIRNVSHTGIGGQGPHMLQIGERMTIFLPGHDPMPGTVRWVQDRRFGIETDRAIDTARLRGAQGDGLTTADSKAEFQIVPAPKLTSRRPGLTLGVSPRNDSWKRH